MQLRYLERDELEVIYELSDRSITIGRSLDSEIVLWDEKSSRVHCGIESVDDDYVLKDLKSKNGVFVNGRRVESAYLTSGDKIQVGDVVFIFEDTGPGTETALKEVQEEMEHGKGYSTIMRELVEEVEQPPKMSDTERITLRPPVPAEEKEEMADTERIPID